MEIQEMEGQVTHVFLGVVVVMVTHNKEQEHRMAH
jgi:hypothetical protein